MKLVSSLKKQDLRSGEFIVRRGKHLYRINKANRKRNAKQG